MTWMIIAVIIGAVICLIGWAGDRWVKRRYERSVDAWADEVDRRSRDN